MYWDDPLPSQMADIIVILPPRIPLSFDITAYPSLTHWTPVTVSFGGWLLVLRRRLASFLTNLNYLNWICKNPDPIFCDIKAIATKFINHTFQF